MESLINSEKTRKFNYKKIINSDKIKFFIKWLIIEILKPKIFKIKESKLKEDVIRNEEEN